eukprot:jgi/Psemu1/308212/fgenesh1_kg.389_\
MNQFTPLSRWNIISRTRNLSSTYARVHAGGVCTIESRAIHPRSCRGFSSGVPTGTVPYCIRHGGCRHNPGLQNTFNMVRTRTTRTRTRTRT